jgi:hypothetical protein
MIFGKARLVRAGLAFGAPMIAGGPAVRLYHLKYGISSRKAWS